jgi:primosomal protein N' (replication factor Y)
VEGRIVRVLPDVPAIDRVFDYAVPPGLQEEVRVGTRVRVPLAGRRVDGWVLEEGVEPPPGVTPRPVWRVKGAGPPPEVLELAAWAAWRWAGRMSVFMATASPPVVVGLPPGGRGSSRPPGRGGLLAGSGPARSTGAGRAGRPGGARGSDAAEVAGEALAAGSAVVRLAPAADPMGIVEAACEQLGDRGVLVLAPSHAQAAAVAARLERSGWPVASLPGDWARAVAGGCVVGGTRSAAWAPLSGLDAAVVLDAHDEAFQEERAPTWSASVVAEERARRSGSPCVLVSPCPTLEMLARGRLVTTSRRSERAGWAPVEVVDRRADDPREGAVSSRLVPFLRSATPEHRVVCVLNRRGRARLLACSACAELARCERCDGPVSQPGPGTGLLCGRCGLERPMVCARCGSQRLRVLRPGVSRLREDLEALSSSAVEEVTGSSSGEAPSGAIVVGTEAVLHRVGRAATVVFIDIDSELLAPSYLANERAMALLARASRLVGGRAAVAGAGGGPGRVVVQTRMPGHEVIAAALHADPGRLAASEAPTRAELRLPPASALAKVSGEAAEEFVRALSRVAPGVEVAGPRDGSWLLRAPGHAELCDALAVAGRPPGRLRIEVDPRRP